MKRKMVFGVLAFLLVFQAQTVFAADYDVDFTNELNRNNIGNIEKLLQRRAREMDLTWCMGRTLFAPESSSYKINNTANFNPANRLEVLRLLVRYGADVNRNYYSSLTDTTWEYPLEYAVKNKFPIAIIQFLLDSGADPNRSISSRRLSFNTPLYMAYRNGDMTLVNILLDKGANGETLLGILGQNPKDNQMIQYLISRGVQVRSEAGASALRWAAKGGNLDMVKLLVEKGVNVNARSNDKEMQEYIPLGATAASVAYDQGNMDIYDYLKANGARDFEPRQVTQQPTQPAAPAQSTTNVYVQPSAPAQPAPAQPAPRPAAPTAPKLEMGTYFERSVTGAEINLFTNTNRATHQIRDRTATSTGDISISGDQLVITWYSGPLSGNRSVYHIDSKNQFSGSGETWRNGF